MSITIKPMKMTDVPVTTADQYISDPNWVMEQKMDGARALVTWNPINGFSWQASGGGPLKFAAAVQHIAAIEEELLELFALNSVTSIVLDGELIVEDGELRVFDVPYVTAVGAVDSTPEKSLAFRIGVRNGLFQKAHLDRVRLVRTAFTPEDKQAMWARINDLGVEGAMVKHLGGTYESGVRTKQQLKLKLVKTADVIVGQCERVFDHKGMVTHGSAQLYVNILPEQDPKPFLAELTGRRATPAEINAWRNGTKREQAKELSYEYKPRDQLKIGAASLIGKDLTIAQGDVVEVAYLYWGGDAIVQPRILRKRLPEEKQAVECWLEQIPAYSRQAV